MMGLSNDIRSLANQMVPDSCNNDQLVASSLAKGGKLIHVWKRSGPDEIRQKSYDFNDGSQYLEPHMRCHQILVERWLKHKVDTERLIQGFWGTTFLGMKEKGDHVVCEFRKSDGSAFYVKSQYVVGCDGGGSHVRRSAGLESKRESL